jgi:P27 family predicted phage terminase small subunit
MTSNGTDAIPEGPEYLSEKAKGLYWFYAGSRVKSPARIALLVVGLAAMDQANEAGEQIREQGLCMTSDRSGLNRRNPLLTVQKEATATMLKVFKMLGLNMEIRTDHFSY